MKPKAMAGMVLLLAPAAGWAGDGQVAVVTCDPSCRDDSGDRYVDCGNGTITDNETGLVWLANANCFGQLSWGPAMVKVAGLSDLPDDRGACLAYGLTPDQCDCGLSDGSSPGDWRLPSIGEWREMIAHTPEGCSPEIASDSGEDCWDENCVEAGACSFYSVVADEYWSSSQAGLTSGRVWALNLATGFQFDLQGGECYVWPVRGGQ